MDRTTCGGAARLERLYCAIEHASHFLPAQGPITVFVHHNTLHAFEDLPFDAGVKEGGRLFGCHAYLPEERCREQLARGRIRVKDLEAALLESLGDEADCLVGSFGTRYALRLAMLQFPLRSGRTAELRWVIAETDALRTFREEVEPSVRDQMIADTSRWVMRDLRNGHPSREYTDSDVLAEALEKFGQRSIESWSEKTWEAFVLNFLWRLCYEGVRSAKIAQAEPPAPFRGKRLRDLILEATGEDADLLVDELLIRLTAAFLDQGFADWQLPDRELGLYRAFLSNYGQQYASPTTWLAELHREVCRVAAAGLSPLESINESLELLGIADDEQSDFILQTLLALRGWAGMVWQMESNAEWAPRPAPKGSLVEFLAVRLILDRVAASRLAREALGFDGPLDQVRSAAVRWITKGVVNGSDQRAFVIFQLAQVRGWRPDELLGLSTEQWRALVQEIEAFSSFERRRIYHSGYERKYRNETLDAVIAHGWRIRERGDAESDPTDEGEKRRPLFQMVCCIDDREESFRRNLEEVEPECETLSVAGFFGVAMYFQGLTEAHFKPLCPVVIKPKHYVREQAIFSLQNTSALQAKTRRRIGHAVRYAQVGSRTLVGGMLTGLLGAFAAFPLVARILFPRTTSQIRKSLGHIVTPRSSELHMQRTGADPGPQGDHLGYSIDEMADIVECTLRLMGLTKTFSPLVLICGHGSSSVNNPHESAYNCGACSGSRGGPNARAFAQMANNPSVRRILAERQLPIPEDVYFASAFHNTCNDEVTWYDVDRIPVTHRHLLVHVKMSVDRARERNAHERCRLFESASLQLSAEDALHHVEGRAEDLSQARPEYNHATNALCFVGSREWSRGLFLDRRAFLCSYQPTQDDERGSILEKLLQAAVPVCAGINLEYYHSTVDVEGYGCGSKLPHNITSLIGVMSGAASDLRPGLSAQMTEIHEPVRLLFVIETSPAIMQRIIKDNESIASLVKGNWVQLAVLDAETSQVCRYVDGEFVPYDPETVDLPVVESSFDWYGGWRDHLGFVSIEEKRQVPTSVASTS